MKKLIAMVSVCAMLLSLATTAFAEAGFSEAVGTFSADVGDNGEVLVYGDYMFISGQTSVGIYDNTDPYAPVLLTNVSDEGRPVNDIIVCNDYLWVAYGYNSSLWSTLAIYDVSSVSAGATINAVRHEGIAQKRKFVLVDNDRLLTISQPKNSGNTVTYSENWTYDTSRSAVSNVETSNVSSLGIEREQNDQNAYSYGVIDENYFYTLYYPSSGSINLWFSIYDMSTSPWTKKGDIKLDNPVGAETVYNWMANGFAVKDKTVYVSFGSGDATTTLYGIYAIDCTNPDEPVFNRNYAFQPWDGYNWTRGIIIDGNYLYTSCRTNNRLYALAIESPGAVKVYSQMAYDNYGLENEVILGKCRNVIYTKKSSSEINTYTITNDISATLEVVNSGNSFQAKGVISSMSYLNSDAKLIIAVYESVNGVKALKGMKFVDVDASGSYMAEFETEEVIATGNNISAKAVLINNFDELKPLCEFVTNK